MTVIKFIGIDGAGKSTYCQRVEDLLQEEGKSVYSMHWVDGSLLGILPESSNKDQHCLSSNSDTTKENGFTQNLFIIYLKFVLIIINSLLVKIYTQIIMISNDVILYDRYLLDDIVHLQYRGLNNKVAYIGMKFVNYKGIVYIDIDPQIAISRNKEHNPEYYYTKKDIYDSTLEGKNGFVIDGQEHPVKAANQIIDEFCEVD